MQSNRAAPDVEDSALTAALRHMAPANVLLGQRLIGAHDGDALREDERPAFAQSIESVRNQSGAARLVARKLAYELGIEDLSLPRMPSRAAHWPPALVGSLAHDEEVAVAALALAQHYAGIGIDVEPSLPLREGLAMRIATAAERARYSDRVLESRLLFVIKEAVFKAQSALDRAHLGFHEVEIDLEAGIATTPCRRIAFVYRELPRILALATIPTP